MHKEPVSVVLPIIILLSIATVQASAQSASLLFLNSILGGSEAESAKGEGRLAGGRLLLSDDPASYAIYDSLAGQVRSLGANIRNSGDMLSYYRLEDSVFGDLVNILQRVRELLVQRADGIYGPDDQEAIDSEIEELYDQATEVLRQAEFNQQKLFLATGPEKAAGMFQGAKYHELASVDALLQFIIKERSTVGASTGALEFMQSGQETESQNTESTLSQGDTDISGELVNLERRHILLLSNILMLKQELR
jgi:flagellin